MRPDRLFSVGIVRPLSRLLPTRQLRIPILMYHGIREGFNNKQCYFETNTAPKIFAAHMKYLHDNGYRTVTMSETLGIGDPKCVAITFDDGYQDFYNTALPILSHYQMSATLFVVSHFGHRASTSSKSHPYMTWKQIREVSSLGIEIGSHTVSHLRLWTLGPSAIEYELACSKAATEQNTGRPVLSFSHPFAFPRHRVEYVRRLCSTLLKCGYQTGVTTIIGTATAAHNPYLLPRLPVNSHDDLNLLKAKLEGDYDWLRIPQGIYQRVSQRSRLTARSCVVDLSK